MNFSNNSPLLMMIAKNSVRLLAGLLLFACNGNAQNQKHDLISDSLESDAPEVNFNVSPEPGACSIATYLPDLKNRRVAIVANHTSLVQETHIVDTLITLDIDVVKVFAPEHGFRGDQDAGAHIKDEIDKRTGLPIFSLHGKTKKPSDESLADVDIVVFDIQDVGVRFYTYISTLHYVMEACAENDVPLIVLDRPNPHLVPEPDGPVLEPEFSSFIGMHPVPVLYGLTIGEYGQMINGESWLLEGISADLTVIPCANYKRTYKYDIPVSPSPNLPNKKSIQLYPSLCFFEGTVVSIGRGTDEPFQVAGHPKFMSGSYTFVPEPNSGSRYPKLEGERCFGISFSGDQAEVIHGKEKLDLSFLIRFYQELDLGDAFFREDGFFNLLAGTAELRRQIQSGASEMEIRRSWEMDLVSYRKMYKKYWIYD